jgi:hypothetical protein
MGGDCPRLRLREFSTRRVSEWLAATLEMWCRVTGCGFESRALRLFSKALRNCNKHKHLRRAMSLAQ